MLENQEKEPRKKRSILRVAKFSRRQFLKRTGVAAAGALITSIAMTTACKTGLITQSTAANRTVPDEPDSSTGAASSSKMTISGPATSANSSAATSISTKPATSVPVTGVYSYIPPTTLPELLPIAGTTCVVAADRSYSTDNIWVKSLPGNIAVMGITTTMVEILYNPYKLWLSQVGTTLTEDDAFGGIEGFKMSADLITPVSGKVIQINDALISLAKQGMPIDAIINDPYNSGWMTVVQLSNSSELSNLVTPQKYIELVIKKY